MLDLSRALTKPTVRTRIAIADVVTHACSRVHVTIRARSPPSRSSALRRSWCLRSRWCSASPRVAAARSTRAPRSRDGHARLAISAITPAPANASESLALATFVLALERGELRCAVGGRQLMVRLPVAASQRMGSAG